MKIAVIIPAAGASTRFNAQRDPLGLEARSKIEQDLAGKPVFLRTLELFVHQPRVRAVILAVNPDSLAEFKFKHADRLEFLGVTVVAGGRQERWETVLKALDAVPEDCTHVAVHDAARPLASAALIERVFDAAMRFSAVIPARPVSATLKRVTAADVAATPADPLDAIFGSAGKPDAAARRVVETLDRRDVVEVQTPQVFEKALLRRAYARISAGAATAAITDDAGLVEALGEPVHVVDGDAANLKITRPDDLQLAEAIARFAETKKDVSLGAKRLFGKDDEE